MANIKVLLVAGAYELICALRNIIDSDTELDIVAEAGNAYDARDRIIDCDPDIMILENELPRMDGITFLERLMPQHPMPAIILAEPRCEEMAYDAGATDFITYYECMPDAYNSLNYENIPERIKKAVYPDWKDNANTKCDSDLEMFGQNEKTVIAIGASTGGTEAIAKVISGFKKDIPGVIMVQHMPEGFTRMYAQRLDNECEVSVKEAKSGDIVKRGQVLLAPGDKHLRLVKVNGLYQVECRAGEKVSGHCPSVDAMFQSVARVAGKDAIGVILTGMGRDGAKGLLDMRRAGARTIGQDEKSCVVYGMPKAAYDIGAVMWQVALDNIASKIYYLLDKNK